MIFKPSPRSAAPTAPPLSDQKVASTERVYAVGDINGRGAFTHTSVNDAEIVLDQMRGGSRKLSDRIPVYGLFIDPALGRVGMTEKEAVAKGFNVLKATRSMARISRAKEMGETQGFAKLVVDADTDLILDNVSRQVYEQFSSRRFDKVFRIEQAATDR